VKVVNNYENDILGVFYVSETLMIKVRNIITMCKYGQN